jgi:hypothetical protein
MGGLKSFQFKFWPALIILNVKKSGESAKKIGRK